MLRFLLARLLRLIPVAWGIISIIFLLSRAVPDDQLVARILEGQAGYSNRVVTVAERQALEQQVRQRLGLDIPAFYFSIQHSEATEQGHLQWNGVQNQYHQWWRDLLRGELGYSYRDNQPVSKRLLEALAFTLPFTLLAALLAVGITLPLAAWMARHPRWRTYLLAFLYGFDTLPLFVVALLLLYSLANPDGLALFPAYGFSEQGLFDTWFEKAENYLQHLALPIASLVLITLPSLVAQLDASLQQELQTAYATTARAKGLPFRQVVRRHALRNALLPVVTLVTDLLPAIVAGAVVVEVIFALPGTGRLLADAAASRDYPILQAVVVLIAVVRLFSHIVADWLYLQIDPRLRSQP